MTEDIVRRTRKKTNKLLVGNISTKRAITDVRDLVMALELLSEKGAAGEVYNVSGEKAYLISDIIEIIKRNSHANFEIAVDSRLLRPTDEPVIFGDSTKLKDCTGWR